MDKSESSQCTLNEQMNVGINALGRCNWKAEFFFFNYNLFNTLWL